jgi:oxygen-dependent protoporphyrinogen oxidase
MLDPEALNLTDQQLASLLLEELHLLTGLTTTPCFVKIQRHPKAIPQFVHGHLEKMRNIFEKLKKLPGLYLAGNYLKGVGLKDAVASGFEAAYQISLRLDQEATQP